MSRGLSLQTESRQTVKPEKPSQKVSLFRIYALVWNLLRRQLPLADPFDYGPLRLTASTGLLKNHLPLHLLWPRLFLERLDRAIRPALITTKPNLRILSSKHPLRLNEQRKLLPTRTTDTRTMEFSFFRAYYLVAPWAAENSTKNSRFKTRNLTPFEWT